MRLTKERGETRKLTLVGLVVLAQLSLKYQGMVMGINLNRLEEEEEGKESLRCHCYLPDPQLDVFSTAVLEKKEKRSVSKAA